jgi:hypothetical protein
MNDLTYGYRFVRAPLSYHRRGKMALLREINEHPKLFIKIGFSNLEIMVFLMQIEGIFYYFQKYSPKSVK